MPSIVAITNQSVQEVQNYFSMFGMGGMPQTQEVESAGSGIIVGQNDSELLIVSNNHVVEGRGHSFRMLQRRRSVRGQHQRNRSDRDLAVIAFRWTAFLTIPWQHQGGGDRRFQQSEGGRTSGGHRQRSGIRTVRHHWHRQRPGPDAEEDSDATFIRRMRPSTPATAAAPF